MDGSGPVIEAIGARLDRHGAIAFEELMDLALYHDRGGLYRRRAPQRGRQGHFSTCAHLDPALGEAVARWIERGWGEGLGRPGRGHVIEVGGGDGSLAATVLDALPRRLRRRITYLMVERGEAALSLQRERLGGRVSWVSSMTRALRRCRGQALIFSNELVDAFPAVALERRDGRWLEVFLVRRGSGLVEELRPPREPLPGELFSVAELTGLPDGVRAEVHRSYRRWLRSWAPLWRRGWLLTIDYGGECGELYGRGGGGTLRAYFSHIRLDDRSDLYHRLGLQDLTCDVNFTDLIRWGEHLGWSTGAYVTQRELLAQFVGLDQEGARPSLGFIADPHGAGGHFRALWQRRTA